MTTETTDTHRPDQTTEPLALKLTEGLGAWLPIATAPQDGTEVLLYAPGRRTYGAWAKPSQTPRIKYAPGFAPEPEWEEFEPYWASWDGGFTDEAPPTHWMPLPAGPQISA